MKSKILTFISAFAGILLFGISMVMIGSILPLLKLRLDLSDIVAGGLFSILPIGLLTGSFYFGPISDKYGYRWVLSSASLFLAFGFIGIAHAPSLWLLRLCILFFGIGGGVINGATSALISDLSSDDTKVANISLLGVFYGLGAFCMPIVLSTINQAQYVTVINIVTVLCIIVGALFLLVSYPITVEKQKISFGLIPLFFKNKAFLIVCFILFFQAAFESIMNNWSVFYFTEYLNVDQPKALISLSFVLLGMTLMRLLMGSVFRKVSSKNFLKTAFIFWFFGSVCLFIKLPAPYYLNTFGLFLIGVGLAPGFPVILGLIGNMFKEISGTAFSFALVVGLSGNVIINYITGVLVEYFGVRAFVYVIFVEIIVMITLYLFIRRDKKVFS
ncbi:MAG: MFS transporter [Dysgonamonadaceae bacterium]|nr:MFS transporter [Dysgonamonadaceae bacterium]